MSELPIIAIAVELLYWSIFFIFFHNYRRTRFPPQHHPWWFNYLVLPIYTMMIIMPVIFMVVISYIASAVNEGVEMMDVCIEKISKISYRIL